MYFQQQPPTFWEGLLSGFMQGHEKQQEAKRNAEAWKIAGQFSDDINNVDTGGKTQLQYTGTNKPGTGLIKQMAPGLFGNTPAPGTTPMAESLWQGGLLGKAGMAQVQPIGMEPDTPDTQQTSPTTFTPKTDSLIDKDNFKQTVTAPKPLAEIKSAIRSQIPQAAKELAARGHDPAKFLPLLQQMANDKIAEHTDQYNNQMVGQLANQFNNETNPIKRAVIAAQMNQYGLKLDPKMISTLQPSYKLMTENYGGTKTYSLFNTKDANDRQQISTGPVTMNEYQQETIRTKDEGNQIRREGNQIRANGNGRPKANSGYSAQQISGAKSVITGFNKWQQANPGADGNDYPYANDVYAAQNILSGAGIPYQGQYVDYGTPSNTASGDENVQPTAEELEMYRMIYGG